MQMIYDQFHDDRADFLRVKNTIRIPMVEKYMIDRTPEELSQTLHKITRKNEALEVLGGDPHDKSGKLNSEFVKENKKPCLE